MNEQIAGGMFRSVSTEGLKSKTCMGIIVMEGEPTVHIIRRFFIRVPTANDKILRCVGSMFFCENAMAFKFNSLLTIIDFVDNFKEEIYKCYESNY